MKTKHKLVQAINRSLFLRGDPSHTSKGSTITTSFLVEVCNRLDLSTSGNKIELAQRIVRSKHLIWNEDCYSKGSTITVQGCHQMLAAINLH